MRMTLKQREVLIYDIAVIKVNKRCDFNQQVMLKLYIDDLKHYKDGNLWQAFKEAKEACYL
jgi:hypothetical protein